MTEIVADKTVEVVKNAIETADGALDLYNKYLDQVIPWQTFDETIKELSLSLIHIWNTLFCRAGDPATMADEACHAFTMLYNAKF